MVSTTFRELGLSAPILRQLENLEYKTPTPIQAACIPLLLQNKDLMGLAQTGTGKTAAFALPLIQQLSKRSGKPPGRRVRALILSPTRELAAQSMKISAPTPEGCICPPPSFSEAWGMLPISRNWPEAWIFW